MFIVYYAGHGLEKKNKSHAVLLEYGSDGKLSRTAYCIEDKLLEISKLTLTHLMWDGNRSFDGSIMHPSFDKLNAKKFPGECELVACYAGNPGNINPALKSTNLYLGAIQRFN